MKNASQRDSRNAKREKEQREEESLEKSGAALLLSASFNKSCLFNNRGFLFLNLSLSYSLETLVHTSEEEFKGEREGF